MARTTRPWPAVLASCGVLAPLVYSGAVIAASAHLGPFTLYARIARDPAWRSLAPATLVLPGAAWLFAEVSGVGISGALRQGLWLLLLFIWIEVVAVRLLRLETGRVELGVSRSTC